MVLQPAEIILERLRDCRLLAGAVHPQRVLDQRAEERSLGMRNCEDRQHGRAGATADLWGAGRKAEPPTQESCFA
jgi:hypothetical protein